MFSSVDTPQSEVFAIHGAEPEILAYAMAKYSRSALSLKEAISELSAQKASEFLNTFYFQYGHRSIADLAHIPFAIENISLLAAIEVVDEQRWDGQERSTRYQDFSKRQYYTPPGLSSEELVVYNEAIHALFDAYEVVTADIIAIYKTKYPIPEGMNEAAYERTIRARAFDEARYLLPMATMTSVGQVVNARTLEEQITRLGDSPFHEVNEIGAKLKVAASIPAFDVRHEGIEEALDEISGKLTPTETFSLKEKLLAPTLVAPTLVKYTESDGSLLRLREYQREVADTLAPRGFSPWSTDTVENVDVTDPEFPSMEIAATLIYEYSNLPLSQIIYKLLTEVNGKGRQYVDEIVSRALEFRGPHSPMPLAFRTGNEFVFDIRMDIGGYRDMHRHRRCTQIAQQYSASRFAVPDVFRSVVRGSADNHFFPAIDKAERAFEQLQKTHGGAHAPYVLPLAAERRFLMKMDLAEAIYIAELRTGPAGHISYRRVAWQIFQHIQLKYPGIAKTMRVTDPDSPLDFFKR